jgi:glutamate synthase (NADPH/NADH) small chain
MIRDNRLTPDEYAKNFRETHPPFDTRDAALLDANRCLFCYDAPCTKSCPTHIDVPKFIKQIATDNIRGSAHTILSANIMGAGCSRVCPVEKLCEGACVYNLMEEEPIPIARLQRYATEKAMEGNWQLFQRSAPVGKCVAVVGAGPAGLSVAHALARAGVTVTIYEKEARGGGLMTYGVAAYKVTPEFCREELEYILSIGGIEIRYGQKLGVDLTLDGLRRDFDAVFLGMGVGVARRLDIPGEELEGVVDAIRFIYSIRSDGWSTVPVGDKVAVIGMGMTAIDAATQAKRLGAREVTLVYRRTIDEMPCTKAELDLAMLDGCRVMWLTAPMEVTGREGQVTTLVCHRMRLGEADSTGRRAPVETGEVVTLEVDMVIKAAGQVPFESLVAGSGLPHRRGRILVGSAGVVDLAEDPGPGGVEAHKAAPVFAGGDCVNGGKEVVDAVQEGKEAAAAILAYFEKVK